MATVETLVKIPGIIVYAADIDPLIYSRFPEEDFPNVRPIALDVCDQAEDSATINHIIFKHGRIDCLINIAGALTRGRNETFRENGILTKEGLNIFAINLAGPLFLMDLVLPFMRENKSGLIINVTSTKYANPDPFSKIYEESKIALSIATQNLRLRERKNGINVVEVQPGMHQTNLDKGIWTANSNQVEKLATQIVFDFYRTRFGGNPNNVAETIRRILVENIDTDRIVVGKDARISVFLNEHLPFWPQIFRTLQAILIELYKKDATFLLADNLDEQIEKILNYYRPVLKIMDWLTNS